MLKSPQSPMALPVLWPNGWRKSQSGETSYIELTSPR